MSGSSASHTVLVLDLVGSGRSTGTASVLDAVLDEALAKSPYPTDSWLRRRDGEVAVLAVPSSVPAAWVAADLVGFLLAALQQVTGELGAGQRFQARLAVEHADPPGGTDLALTISERFLGRSRPPGSNSDGSDGSDMTEGS